MAGRTPNFQKPVGSASKFPRPRSMKKQDANSTVMGSEGGCFSSTSTRSLNTTVRRHLDITLARAGPPQIKTKFGPPAVDHDLDLSLAYNEYLQAIIMKQIARKTNQEHTSLLDNQILIQSENLHNVQQNYEEIQQKIENLEVQSEVVEILDFLSDNIINLNNIFNKLDTKRSVVSLCDTLTEESNLLKLNNIKPIETQDEYIKLMENVSNLVLTLDKILNSGRNFSGISQLAEEIKRFNELKKKVEDFQKKIDQSRKLVTVTMIHNASDMFASLGGYD